MTPNAAAVVGECEHECQVRKYTGIAVVAVLVIVGYRAAAETWVMPRSARPYI